MDDSKIEFDKKLRDKFREYLKNLQRTKNKRVLYELFEGLKKLDLEIYLFGGFAKDIYVKGYKAVPRDIDLVIVESNLDPILSLFKNYAIRESRFGGYKVTYKGLNVDFWSIEKTWAFEHKKVNLSNIHSLSQTTFLNIESLAIELFPKRRSRKIISEGFTDALRENIIELNLEENPFPELNIARSLYAAKKLDQSFGPKLLRFISTHLENCDVDEILSIYKRRYGLIEKEERFYKLFLNKLRKNDFDSIQISKLKKEFENYQMSLFDSL